MAGWKADCRGGRCCACCCKTCDDTQARSRSLAVAVPRHIVPVLFSVTQMRSFLCNERNRCSEEPQQHTNNRHSLGLQTERQRRERKKRECAHAKGKHCSLVAKLSRISRKKESSGSRGMDCNLLLRVRTTKRDADSAKTECEQKSLIKTKNFKKKTSTICKCEKLRCVSVNNQQIHEMSS
jgi:hypothetical protein